MLIAIANTYVTRQQSSQKLQNLEDTGLLTKTKPHSRRPSPYAAGKKEVWGISFSPSSDEILCPLTEFGTHIPITIF